MPERAPPRTRVRWGISIAESFVPFSRRHARAWPGHLYPKKGHEPLAARDSRVKPENDAPAARIALHSGTPKANDRR
ncbi:hypothetical protein BOSEA31B_11960 [Hyphomicrobiales bacterium]|nr:hypothetical protein BOSEA31B_11960 [Hyphomicrobiales bacterium]CAH1697739.1 hypothetical protein BOSEA1005_10784 [Hyphomicrobiales bacterium]